MKKKFLSPECKVIWKNIFLLFSCLILLAILVIPLIFAIDLPPPPSSPGMANNPDVVINTNLSPSSLLPDNSSFNYLPYIILAVFVVMLIIISIIFNKRFKNKEDINKLNRGKKYK